MGFPVITVNVSVDKTPPVAVISQKRFLLFDDQTLSDKKTYRYLPGKVS
jgi:hypothetical protein